MTDGRVVWITGLPSSGKTTLARAAASELGARGELVLVLDGDEVREALHPAPGYDDAARADFYATLGALAALAAKQGAIVLVPATANRRAFREAARAMAPRFVEVFVDVPLDVCVARDAKGLYAKAAAGGASTMPGRGASYEPPTAPDLVLHGEASDVAKLADACTR
jgi:adenylylsulfate kinase